MIVPGFSTNCTNRDNLVNVRRWRNEEKSAMSSRFFFPNVQVYKCFLEKCLNLKAGPSEV